MPEIIPTAVGAHAPVRGRPPGRPLRRRLNPLQERDVGVPRGPGGPPHRRKHTPANHPVGICKQLRAGRLFWLVPATLLAQSYLSTLPVDNSAPLDNPVERLRGELASGKVTLAGLADLLAHLDIRTDTQALVFSKTSFQGSKIGPRN